MQIVAGEAAVDHFQAGKFDEAVVAVVVEAGGFGIKNDLAQMFQQSRAL